MERMESMEHVFEEPVPNAKALFGAAFLQYLLFGVVYIAEGFNYVDMKNKEQL
jgi:hypothetical protein